VHGSGALTRWLLGNWLVDEIKLLITVQVYRPGGRPQYATDVPAPST
jgi:hypothetical protein